jgi:hypothetical protein
MRVTAFVAVLTIIVIKGFPLNEITSDLHRKAINNDPDKTTTAVNDLNPTNFEPHDNFKNAAEARNL